MTKAIQQVTDDKDIYESLALRGDLSGLAPEAKAQYYSALCQRLGLDPATQPFAILKLSGKETMYATKGCTDQLARIHKVNRTITKEETVNDCYIVTVEARLPDGRTEQSKGAVSVGNLKGDSLCNGIMKAETKAKRRATLSILGLGLLDETELETIPDSAENGQHTPKQLAEPEDPERQARLAAIADICRWLNRVPDTVTWSNTVIKEMSGIDLKTCGIDDLDAVLDMVTERIAIIEADDTSTVPAREADSKKVEGE